MITHRSSSRNKLAYTLALVVAGFLVGFYIFQLNTTATLAWRVAETEYQVTELKHANTALQTKAYRALSLSDLQELANQRNFQKITFITYLRPLNGPVAQNQ